ncbi:MAG: response regulator transcription factor [Gammaproteobacteria bacterium]|nr:response regulator transcription factor [Gammaproteobacteria bacterium]
MSTSVAIVEDDPQFRAAFAAAVAAASDLTLAWSAVDGTDAIARLATNVPDVLLVDLGLPRTPGIEVIRHAAVTHLNCDILVVTVFGDERHVLESIEAGACGYLLKDAGPEDFVRHIRMIRAGGSPISPVIARQLLTRFQARPAEASGESTSAAPDPSLSERERSVLSYIAKGFTFEEIAGLLSVSRHTVTTYVKRIYRKLQVNSKTEAVYEGRRIGLVRD